MGVLQQQQQGGGLPQTEDVPPPAIALPQAQAQAQAGAPPQGAPAGAGAGMPPQGGPPVDQGPVDADGLPVAAKRPGPAGYHKAPGVNEEQANRREQKEYERAMRALMNVLYENDSTSNAIMQQINPEDPISSTVKAGVLLINELDKKVDMDENIIAPVTMEVVTRLMELAENRHGIEFQENEGQAIMGATWEGVMTSFGVDQRD